MYHKGLIPLLLTLLERDNDDLLVHVVSFLKKMSIFKENKDEMVCVTATCTCKLLFDLFEWYMLSTG